MTAEHWQSLTPLSVTRTKEAEAGPESRVSSEQRAGPAPATGLLKHQRSRAGVGGRGGVMVTTDPSRHTPVRCQPRPRRNYMFTLHQEQLEQVVLGMEYLNVFLSF